MNYANCAAQLASIVLLLALSVHGAEAQNESIAMPTRAQIGRNEAALVLNGTGTRSIMAIKVYAVALYLPARTGDSKAILRANLPSRLYFRLMRDVTTRQLASGIIDAMDETVTVEERSSLEPQLKQLNSILSTSPDLKKGTEIAMDYLPQLGTTILVNGREKGRISGSIFNEALLRIWIGDRSRDSRLRKALLGEPTDAVAGVITEVASDRGGF